MLSRKKRKKKKGTPSHSQQVIGCEPGVSGVNPTLLLYYQEQEVKLRQPPSLLSSLCLSAHGVCQVIPAITEQHLHWDRNDPR